MNKKILVDVQTTQTRVALVEEGKLTEYYVERAGNERLVGNIYKGKVKDILPGMNAAFVDIGLNKNAFLYAGDIALNTDDFEFKGSKTNKSTKAPPIKSLVKQGQELIVQVVKEPLGTKGARISTNLTIPGRTLVLMPTVDYVGVSRRISDENERTRLKAIAESVAPENMGIIVRTVAEGNKEDNLVQEIGFLCEMWEDIRSVNRYSNAPSLLHSDSNLLLRTIRDMFDEDVDELLTNDMDSMVSAQTLARSFSPKLVERIKHFDDGWDIFDYHNIEGMVDKSFARKVWLSSGGYLIFDYTEAFTVIDVNTGKFVGNKNLATTILKTNVEAAKVIGRQLRLRDIGGIIIIDFIDMNDDEHKQIVLDTLAEAVSTDRTRTTVMGMTSLGLVEMTRKKVRRRVSTIMQKTCPYCSGLGLVLTPQSVGIKILREIRRITAHTVADKLVLKAHQDVIDWLEDEKLLDANVEIYRSRSMHIEQFSVSPEFEII